MLGKELLAALPIALVLAGCGGSGNGNTDNPTVSGNSPLVLSGWYQCVPSASSASIENATTSVLATAHGNFYGQCTGGYDSVNVSGNYSGTVGVLTGSGTPVTSATLTNFQFYDPKTSLVATNEAGTVLPVDTYSSVPPSQSLNSKGTISFTETGKTSQGGAPAMFTVPTTLSLVGPVTPPALSATAAGSANTPPTTAGGYAGNYSNMPLPPAGYGILSGATLSIDANGNFSGITSAGSLSGSVSAYDPKTGTAEYAGTLTTSAGAMPVQGAYSSNYYTVTEPNLAIGSTGQTTYAPLALFIKGQGFQYELLVIPAK